MALRIGLIGGTGLYALADSEPVDVETPHGSVVLARTQLGGREVFFLPRHGPMHEHVPLRVPHAAHIHALRAAHCDYVIGVNNVGSLRADLKPPAWFIPKDFIDLHHSQRLTQYADAPVHVDFTEPYCPEIRKSLQGAEPRSIEGTYVGVDGPRFETPGEVRWMAGLGGDVVGMTGVPETILAHEVGICYASLCFVANHATGLGGRVRPDEIQTALSKRVHRLREILASTIRALPQRRRCHCAKIPVALTTKARGR